MFQKLPQDVVKRILSLLDIDRRRALGVYTKIKVPFDIKNNLDFVLTNYRIKYVFDSYFKRIEKAILNLNSLYILLNMNGILLIHMMQYIIMTILIVYYIV